MVLHPSYSFRLERSSSGLRPPYEAPITLVCPHLVSQLGLDREGSQEELASRLIEELEAHEGEEWEEGEEGLESYPEALEDTVQADCSAALSAGQSIEDDARLAANTGRELGSVRNERLRRSLDWRGLVAQAAELKALANEQFQRGATDVALCAYLGAIWLLKPEAPSSPNSLASAIWAVKGSHSLCPHILESHAAPMGFEAVRLLGEGTAEARPSDLRRQKAEGTGGEMDIGVGEWLRWAARRRECKNLGEQEGTELGSLTCELRLSLHLNVAAAALKAEDHELAAQACQFVLRRSPEHPKALYRVAAAHRGLGKFKPALEALSKLLGLPGQRGNAEARQLMASIHEQVI